MRILLIEDQERLATNLKQGLELEGFAVDVQTDGLTAYRHASLNHEDYDLILLDIMLPGKDGISIMVNRLLEEVVRKLGPYAASKNVKLTIPDRTRELPDIHVAGDWLRMLEVFLNIVRNSIEYSKPGGGEVVVKVSRYLTSKVATIKVTDYGVGIPLEHQPAVFTPFYRADKTKAKTEGSGLGLAIAKSIVEEAGGSIRLTSIENVRTTVAVDLRRVEATRGENQESGKAEELSRRS